MPEVDGGAGLAEVVDTGVDTEIVETGSTTEETGAEGSSDVDESGSSAVQEITKAKK